MRTPEYLSPSSYMTWKKDPSEFYKKYLAPTRPLKYLQTKEMALGSAFDAFIKSYLHNALYGQGFDPKYQKQTLFESQVEEQNRDLAYTHGSYVFERYLKCGAAADLMTELNKAVDLPRFEFDIKGTINGSREGVTKNEMGVPLLGKPDVKFINSEGAHVILDWKVNGFYNAYNTSPAPGYVKIRDAWSSAEAPPCRGGQMHKDCIPGFCNGMFINMGTFFEACQKDWAIQLAIYGWLMGEPVGSETLVGVDQICGYKKDRPLPLLRIASHRAKISSDFQFDLMADLQNLWGIITDRPFYFFRELSFEDSKIKCDFLDSQSELSHNAGDAQWIMDMSRGDY